MHDITVTGPDGARAPATPRRRALVAGAAWSAPAVLIAPLAPAAAATVCPQGFVRPIECPLTPAATMPIEFLLFAGDQATNTSLPGGTQIKVSLVTRSQTTRQLITVGGVAKYLGGSLTPTDTAVTGTATTWDLVVANDLSPGMVTAFKLDTGTLIDSGYRIQVTTILPGGCGSSSVCWSPPTDGCHYGNECSFPS